MSSIILAVDDQPMILKSIKHSLRLTSDIIITAENGVDALQQFRTHKPDLIILDLNMPYMSGEEVIKVIRDEEKSGVPIIVMSGKDDTNVMVDTFQLGADDYIQKPAGLKELEIRARKLLNLPLITNKRTNEVDTGIMHKHSVGVVIPCYNESKRLRTSEFSAFINNNHGYHLCFVNDGSTDDTLEVLNRMASTHEEISVYDCEKNGGKAEAVRQGVLHLVSDPNIDYIGYLDADLSTNFQDFDDLVQTISSSEYQIVGGSRIDRMGANIMKESSRKIISKTINMIIQKILGMKFQDTQCGAKIMTREVASMMFNKKFLTRWLFDVEIFLRMKKYYGAGRVNDLICEQPLKRWVHEDGSNLSFKDSVKIVTQLFQLAVSYR